MQAAYLLLILVLVVQSLFFLPSSHPLAALDLRGVQYIYRINACKALTQKGDLSGRPMAGRLPHYYFRLGAGGGAGRRIVSTTDPCLSRRAAGTDLKCPVPASRPILKVVSLPFCAMMFSLASSEEKALAA